MVSIATPNPMGGVSCALREGVFSVSAYAFKDKMLEIIIVIITAPSAVTPGHIRPQHNAPSLIIFRLQQART